jgi:flavin reductase (DIM6/NTAB) family NADH-FMN oxidoreductase RutF
MITLDPKSISTAELHGHMLHAVAPRPIAFASTIDEDGHPNLAPFSFYNAYSSNPPTLVFSANRRVKNNTIKDTYQNIKANGEVVINAVSYNIVRQAALASVEYPATVNEFEKTGLTPLASVKVKPLRVAESPVQFECKVKQTIELGPDGGAGNLFVCEILLMHISQSVLNEKGKIDPDKIDLCARMGGALYARASGDAIFELYQPVDRIVIGFDGLPEKVRLSKVLTGSDLAMLANVVKIPQKNAGFHDERLQSLNGNADGIHLYVKELLHRNNDIEKAWQVLLSGQ